MLGGYFPKLDFFYFKEDREAAFNKTNLVIYFRSCMNQSNDTYNIFFVKSQEVNMIYTCEKVDKRDQ